MHTTWLKPRQHPHVVKMLHSSDWSGPVSFHLTMGGVGFEWSLPGFVVEAIRDGAVEEVDAWKRANPLSAGRAFPGSTERVHVNASFVIPPATVEFLRRWAEHALNAARASLSDRDQQASAASRSTADAEDRLSEAAAHIATLSLTPNGPGELGELLATLKARAAHQAESDARS